MVLTATASVFAGQQPFMQAGTAQPPLLPLPPVAAVSTNNVSTNNVSPNNATTNTVSVPASNPVSGFFNSGIPGAIAKGKFNLNVRLRYEQADEQGVAAITENSYAPTLRTRFGYTTAPLYGFQGMLEAVNVSVIGPESNYNAAGSNGQGNRPVVADPPMTRLDQAWLAYSFTNWFFVKAGQQPIDLDNQRFIGDSAWRQNMQTFDAISAGGEPLKGLNFFYSYIGHVYRVYGDVSGLPPANTDFDSHSSLINVSCAAWKFGRFVGYTYLLDLSNAAGAANSCATYGGYFAGNAAVNDDLAFNYRAEGAWQTEYSNSPLDYGAKYLNFEGGANLKPVALGGGFEDLGSSANTGAGGGRTSVRTPLATFHAFNGWDNVFQTTPANGLHDLYGYLQWTLPAQVPIRFVYHKFNPDFGSGNFGQEFDVMATKKFGKYWNVLLEYANYQGQDAAPPALTVPNVNMQRFWAQVEFNF
jgi:hypothetical protein